MSWSATCNLLRQRFVAAVARPLQLAVVAGNQPMGDRAPAARWCRLSVQAASRDQVLTGSAGKRRFRTRGVLFAVLMEPMNAGDGEQNRVVDAIQAAFTNVTLTSADPQVFVRCRPPYADGEALPDGPWWARTVQIPFDADDFGG